MSKPIRKSNLEAILLKWLRDKLEQDTAPARAPAKPTAAAVSEEKAIAAEAPEHYGIDPNAFANTQTLLGSKLSTVLSYYLEDADDYLSRISQALEQNDPAGAITPAHTLKSSSRQLGAVQLADLAMRAEAAARALSQGEKAEDLAPLVASMRDALANVRPFFNAMRSKAA